MTHRGLRAFLVVLAFGAAAGAGYLLWKLDHRAAERQAASRTFEDAATRALVLVERFRAAQQSYVADGQGSEFWMARAKDVLDQLDRSLTTLAGTAHPPELRDAARSTAGTVEELRRMDVRAREWLRGGQGLMASDLIFTESLALSGSLAERVSTLQARHRQLADAEQAAMELQQLYIVAGAAATCLIVALLLAPAVRPSTPQDTREALRALIGEPATVPVARTEPAAAAAPAARLIAPDPPPSPAPVPAPAPPAVPGIDVPAAAGVCAGLARVLDPAELPGLLARSAEVLGATGLIVWVADDAGSALFPMLAHGYPASVIARLGHIGRDDENATAAAYRLSQEQVVGASNGRPGAIVTPIITPDGCIGVLAAEVERGAEHHRDRRALAAILAAQLATLVTALPAPERAMQAQG